MPNTQGLQTQAGQTRQIGLELAWRLRFKHRSNRRRTVVKGVQDVCPDLKSIWTDARPQPSHHMGHIAAGLGQVRDQGLQNTLALWSCQTPPARMGCSHPLAFGITQQHRQTIGHHDGASHLCPLSPAGIGHRTIRAGTGQMD
jgi:hypothetical protein